MFAKGVTFSRMCFVLLTPFTNIPIVRIIGAQSNVCSTPFGPPYPHPRRKIFGGVGARALRGLRVHTNFFIFQYRTT